MPRPDHYLKPGTTQTAAPNNNSAAWASAFNSRYVRIYSPVADCFVIFAAAAPTATASHFPICAGVPEIIDTGDGLKYGAVFCASNVTVYATPMG